MPFQSLTEKLHLYHCSNTRYCIFAALQKHSPNRKQLALPIKSVLQGFTCLPASLGKAALAFTPHLIYC
jgi:hypothetical protein